MSQMIFSDFECAGRPAVRVSWPRWSKSCRGAVVALIEPHYPKASYGLKPYRLETMLRIHLQQNWFSLSDPAMEESPYEITSMRQFARLTLSTPIP